MRFIFFYVFPVKSFQQKAYQALWMLPYLNEPLSLLPNQIFSWMQDVSALS